MITTIDARVEKKSTPVRVGSARVFSGIPVDVCQYAFGEEYRTFTRWAVCFYEDADDPEGWITAEAIAFPGISSEGETKEEAVDNVREALRVFLSGASGDESLPMRTSYEIPAGGTIEFIDV
jgi:predicted RNase H-like HicB family nuclease